MSKTSGHNNFADPNQKAKAKYKLWVLWKPEYAHLYPRVYFSYTSHNKDGLNGLLILAHKRQDKADLMIIYDNQTGERLDGKVLYKDPNYTPQPK